VRRFPLLPLLLAACVPAAPPPAAPPPRPAAPVAAPAPAPLTADWRDWPRTPGDWSYERAGSESRATFRPAGVSLSCGTDRRLRLAIAGRAMAPVMIRTSTASRLLSPDAAGTLSLQAQDRLLDAMAFSRGRFVLEQAGAAPLVLPSWAEMGRVIEDCRG